MWQDDGDTLQSIYTKETSDGITCIVVEGKRGYEAHRIYDGKVVENVRYCGRTRVPLTLDEALQQIEWWTDARYR